jgi:uncharacterized membrane protein YhaH (DUF805 family)
VTDARPRPEYGEYATNEEQAAAMGVVYQPVAEPVAELAPPVPLATSPATPTTQPRRWDLVTTIALIIFGVYVTVSGFVTYGDLPSSLTQIYAMYDYDAGYAGSSLAGPFGTTINIVQAVLLVLTVYLSSRRLRTAKITFWIPLVAGAISSTTSTVLLMILLFSDAGFVQFMSTSMGV